MENLEKLQVDREELQSVMVTMLDEVVKNGTFESLLTNNKEFKEDKAHMEKTIIRCVCVCVSQYLCYKDDL